MHCVVMAALYWRFQHFSANSFFSRNAYLFSCNWKWQELFSLHFSCTLSFTCKADLNLTIINNLVFGGRRRFQAWLFLKVFISDSWLIFILWIFFEIIEQNSKWYLFLISLKCGICLNIFLIVIIFEKKKWQ